MYVGLKQPRGDGECYVTPARAAAKETRGLPTAASLTQKREVTARQFPEMITSCDDAWVKQ